MAVCRLVSRRNDTPHLVALQPQPERRTEDGVQLAPPGFHVIYLPFAGESKREGAVGESCAGCGWRMVELQWLDVCLRNVLDNFFSHYDLVAYHHSQASFINRSSNLIQS